MNLTIEDIRRSNARFLALEAGGHSKFAERVGQSRQRVSHCIGKNPSKNVGSAFARDIERIFGRPEGWMDRVHAPAKDLVEPRLEKTKIIDKAKPVPAGVAKQTSQLKADFLACSEGDRRAILARAARGAKRAVSQIDGEA